MPRDSPARSSAAGLPIKDQRQIRPEIHALRLVPVIEMQFDQMFGVHAGADHSGAGHGLGNRGFRQRGTYHSNACDFAKAGRVLQRLAPLRRSIRGRAAGFHVTPHRLLNRGVQGDVNR